MLSKDPTKQPIALIKASLITILNNPVILFPYAVIAFIQLFVLEICFFAPRYPLRIVFGQIIERTAGEIFMHYPFNYILLTKWFQAVQIPIYVLISSFLIGTSVLIIHSINSDKKINFKTIIQTTLPSYIHLLVAAVLSALSIKALTWCYGLVLKRAAIIRSTTGIYFMIKKTVFLLGPYFNLLFAIIVTTLFAFMIPIIVIEKKKIFSALVLNFRRLMKSFWFVFFVILLTGILYFPVLLLRLNSKFFQETFSPDIWLVFLTASVVFMLLIDAIQYTAITTYYLLKKEVLK